MLQEDTILWRHGVLAERDREKMLLWSPSRNEENMWEKLAKPVQDAHINVECLQKARTKQGSVRGWLYCGVLAVAVLLQRWRRRHRCSPVSQWGPGSTRHPLIHPQIFFKMSRRMIAASIVQRDIPYDKIWDFSKSLNSMWYWSIAFQIQSLELVMIFYLMLSFLFIHHVHSNLSKASMEWTKHRWLIVNLNLVSHRKQSASTETVTSWRKRETWRRWALIPNEYWLLHYCLQR